MGFFGLGTKEKIDQSGDAKAREERVRAIPVAEQGKLCEIALGDADSDVRVAAAARIREPEYLESLSRHKDPAVARIARDRLTATLVDDLKKLDHPQAASRLAQVAEQSSLAEIALRADKPAMREAAFVRLCALPEVTQSTLAIAAIQEPTGAYGRKILDRIDTRQLLKDLSKKAKDAGLRAAAAAKLAAIDAEAKKPSPEQRRRALAKDLKGLMERAQVLAISERWDDAAAELAGIASQRDALLNGAADLERDARIDEPLAAIARSQETFARRRREAAALVERQTAAATAKSALLGELEAAGPITDAAQKDALRARWEALGDAGPEQAALERRLAPLLRDAAAAATLAEAPEASAPATPRAISPETQVKADALIAEAQALITAQGPWRDRDFRYKELDKQFRMLGLESHDAPRIAFLDAYVAFKDARRNARNEMQAQRDTRLEAMQALITEAEALAAALVPAGDAGALDARRGAIKTLQNRWAAVGKVPANVLGDLRNRFRAACDTAYEPVKAQDEEREWERFAKIPAAEALIQQVQAALTLPDPVVRHEAVKAAQGEWKNIGRLPRERNDALWASFKAACDQVYDGLKDWFAERDRSREAAQQKKEALLVELEQLLTAGPIGIAGSIADRDSRAGREDRVKDIQAAWREAGPAPRSCDQELWTRYKKLLDLHYAKKREEWSARDGERVDNLHRKQAICVEAEQLATDVETYKAGTPVGAKTEPDFLREVKELQKQYRFIGHVPKEQYEPIRERFKTACDRIYNALESWFAAQDGERQGNLEQKQKLLAEIEALLQESRPDWFKDEAKAIQAKWREIGQVPRENMDINERFRAACDRIFNAAPAPADATVR